MRAIRGVPTGAEAITASAFPLSFAQERLWLFQQLEPHSAAYNLPTALRAGGPLDRTALERALTLVVARHESLRTAFPPGADGGPVQQVAPPPPVPVEFLDLSALPVEQREAAARRLVAERAWAPFDITRGPLLRAGLVRLDAEDHVLVLVLHHLVADAWSMAVLSDELGAAYAAFASAQEPALPALALQYADYAAWQRRRVHGDRLERRLAFWREELAGLRPLALPVDSPPPAPGTPAAREVLHLDAALVAALRALGKRERASLYMVLLAAVQVLLARWTGRDDVVVGTPIADRPRPELHRLIGFFVNTVPLRADLGGDPEFTEVLRRARDRALRVFEQQEAPVERLAGELGAARAAGANPLYRVMFALQNTPRADLRLGDATLSAFASGPPATFADLDVNCVEADGALSIELTADGERLGPATVGRLARSLDTLLGAIVADPQATVAALPLVAEGDRPAVLDGGRAPIEGTVVEAFTAAAARDPGAAAVDGLTYAELRAWAERLAGRLRAEGVGPGVVVAVRAERGPDLVTALLGVLAAGGAYLPIDPDLPEARVRLLLADSGAALLLGDQVGVAPLPGDPPTLLLAHALAQPAAPPPAPPGPGDLAAVFYTSGSTGAPKGVEVEHGGLVNTIAAERAFLRLAPGDRQLQAASCAFDVSLSEVLTTLTAGATLVTAPAGTPPEEVVRAHAVTVAQLPPSLLALLTPDSLPSLRTVVTSGEACPAAVAAAWAGRVRLVNAYGPTEATISACLADLDGYGEPPIGRPLPNTTAAVLDRHRRPVPVGVPGELHLGGAGVARGYRHRADLTAERFVPGLSGARWYATGDRARLREDGQLEFLGRLDGQVQLRGVRVELGEVEARLAEHPAVRQAAAAVHGAQADARLVGYVVARPGAEPSADELRGFLRTVLPEQLVPAAVMALDALPLTPAGKLDRAALPAPRAEPVAYVAPRDAAEQRVAAIWAEVLGVDRVGALDDFFDLGGHSLLATRAVARAGDAFGCDVGLRTLFAAPTVAAFTRAVEDLLVAELAELSDEEAERLLAGQEGGDA